MWRRLFWHMSTNCWEEQTFPCWGFAWSMVSWNRVILEKLTGFQLVKKFPAFYGTQRFITAFKSVRHLSLSWARSIQSILSHPTSWRSILILSSHLCLGLPSGSYPQVSLPNPCILLSTIRATCHAHLILLNFITRTILGEEYRVYMITFGK